MFVLFLLTVFFVAAMWIFRHFERKAGGRKWFVLEVASGALGTVTAVIGLIASCSQL